MSNYSAISVVLDPMGSRYVFTLHNSTVWCKRFDGNVEDGHDERVSFFDGTDVVGVAGEADKHGVKRCYCLKSDGSLMVAVSMNGGMTWNLHNV